MLMLDVSIDVLLNPVCRKYRSSEVAKSWNTKPHNNQHSPKSSVATELTERKNKLQKGKNDLSARTRYPIYPTHRHCSTTIQSSLKSIRHSIGPFLYKFSGTINSIIVNNSSHTGVGPTRCLSNCLLESILNRTEIGARKKDWDTIPIRIFFPSASGVTFSIVSMPSMPVRHTYKENLGFNNSILGATEHWPAFRLQVH